MSDAACEPGPEPGFAALLACHPELSLGADGLSFEQVTLAAIADALGTPCWVYSSGALLSRLAAFTGAIRAMRS